MVYGNIIWIKKCPPRGGHFLVDHEQNLVRRRGNLDAHRLFLALQSTYAMYPVLYVVDLGRIELPSAGCKPAVLPLNYGPKTIR